jgi:hypothetical protein
MVSCLFWLAQASGQDAQKLEYKVKAAFIFNFTKFVEWPPDAFAGADAPLTIGILGENPFGTDLEEIIRDKTVDNRPLKAKQIRTLADCTNCNLLFLGTAERDRVKDVLEKLHGTSVLTVSETDGFTEAGGMINFVREGNKFRFQINNKAAQRAKLKISSKMLGLAIPSDH